LGSWLSDSTSIVTAREFIKIVCSDGKMTLMKNIIELVVDGCCGVIKTNRNGRGKVKGVVIKKENIGL